MRRSAETWTKRQRRRASRDDETGAGKRACRRDVDTAAVPAPHGRRRMTSARAADAADETAFASGMPAPFRRSVVPRRRARRSTASSRRCIELDTYAGRDIEAPAEPSEASDPDVSRPCRWELPVRSAAARRATGCSVQASRISRLLRSTGGQEGWERGPRSSEAPFSRYGWRKGWRERSSADPSPVFDVRSSKRGGERGFLPIRSRLL